MAVFKNYNENELIINCDCGCDDGIHLKIEDYEDGTYAFLTYINGNFYKEQSFSFVSKLKKIWAIIRGKDFYYSDIVMKKEDFEKFKEWINKQ